VKVRFFLDETTGLPHISNHGVNEEEVEDVLTNPGEDRTGREGSRVAIGQTSAGRYLRAIYVRDPEPDSLLLLRPMNSAGDRFWHIAEDGGRNADEAE